MPDPDQRLFSRIKTSAMKHGGHGGVIAWGPFAAHGHNAKAIHLIKRVLDDN